MSRRPKIPEIDPWIILEGYMGSISHGTFVPSEREGIDDKDVMGIAIPPKSYYYGLQNFEHKHTKIDEWDIVIYEIRKYFRLLIKSNPNVLGLLWLKPNLYTTMTPQGKLLIENRKLFLSNAVYKSFCGYASSQLHKMTNWGEGSFKSGYMGKKRKELVDKYGYDVKNSCHLIRLLRMGIELLMTGEVNVERPDANYLIDIKQGKYSLSHIVEESERLFGIIHEALVKSVLPNKLNIKKIDELLIEIISSKHSEYFLRSDMR